MRFVAGGVLRRQPYDPEWFTRRQRSTRQSAEAMLPYVLALVGPGSVVDVGCGLGTWLAVARERGVKRILGVDGDYVDLERLEIPRESFTSWDLRQPLRLGEVFDLALSLEVAEHLPPGDAGAFIRSLVELAPAILFSAAVPFQGGTGHLNEQWPAYWARLFAEHDFVAIDCLRHRFWRDQRVRYFYAQNALLYVDKARLADYSGLGGEVDGAGELPLPLVHPRLYASSLRRIPIDEATNLRALARVTLKLAASPFRSRSHRTAPTRGDLDDA